MLEMSVEEQEERVRGRHEGSQNAVDLMRVGGTSSNFMIVIIILITGHRTAQMDFISRKVV